MRYVKWTFILVFWSVVAAFFHYTLPQRDVVRITDTYLERIDFGENSIFWSHATTGDAANLTNRDVFFIQAFRTNSKPMIYRNEDTGWGWPPFFKFNSTNLQASASDLESKSTAVGAQWAVIRHYGWRNEFMSIYPNALRISPATGPDHQLGLPWLNILILTLFAAIVYGIWVRWRRFRTARIDPTLEEISDNWEAAGDAMEERGSRIRRWWNGRRGK
jgi:hypothetical protein